MTTTVEQTRRHLRRLEDERARTRRRVRLVGKLPAAAELLREQYTVTEITVFGSLAVGDDPAMPDVDLAVRGLDGPRYFSGRGVLVAEIGR